MDLDERELIVEAQKGDQTAFEKLVYKYDKRVLSLAACYTSDCEEAKDIYQEVFIRVYRALPKFRFESRFSTWLYRIVVNVCLTHRARAAERECASLDAVLEGEDGQRGFDLPDEGVTPSDRKALGAEITRHVHAAMGSLSPQQKMAFTLRHYGDYKLREIATMMNCAEGTVKKYLFTATQRLRHQLRPVLQ
jgi:RNA polymerase sigma-70 factor (ECF subfamily)